MRKEWIKGIEVAVKEGIRLKEGEKRMVRERVKEEQRRRGGERSGVW